MDADKLFAANFENFSNEKRKFYKQNEALMQKLENLNQRLKNDEAISLNDLMNRGEVDGVFGVLIKSVNMNIKFVASVLAKGNHVFQASITILDDGVKVKIPGFWKDRETYLTFEEIKGIELNTPSWYSVLSYSTISFFARGIRVEAHGFATSDAKKIKRYVEDGQRGNNKSYGRSSDYRNSDRDKYYSEESLIWMN